MQMDIGQVFAIDFGVKDILFIFTLYYLFRFVLDSFYHMDAAE